MYFINFFCSSCFTLHANVMQDIRKRERNCEDITIVACFMYTLNHAILLRFLNHPAKRESLGIDTDLDTLDLVLVSALALRSAKITAGVVSGFNKSADEADLESLRLTAFRLGGDVTGGGGGAVGGLGGLAAGAGKFPGSTVTRVAGLAYRFPLS